MKPRTNNLPISARRKAAFNLVEVALAMAIVSFGMMAVFGILPAGVMAQRDSRIETIINYDARYWMEAIRSGQVPLNFNYNPDGSILSVKEWQSVSHSALESHVSKVRVARLNAINIFSQANHPPTTTANPIGWPESVIGRLSFPDSLSDLTPPEPVIIKTAKVRSLTGRLGGPVTGDAGFYYLLETKIEPLPLLPASSDISANLYQVRLIFRWPFRVDSAGDDVLDPAAINPLILNPPNTTYYNVPGASSKTFTTLVSGSLFGGYYNTDPARKVNGGEDWVSKRPTVPAPVNEYSGRLHYFRPTMFEPYK